MKRNALAAILTTCTLVLAACGTNAAPTSPAAQPASAAPEASAAQDAADQAAGEAEAPAEAETQAEAAETEEPAAAAEAEAPAADENAGGAAADEEARAMTDAELSFFTDYFRTQAHYGFLQSAYDDPKDINWDLVFYTQGVQADDKETQAYLKAMNQEEIFTNLVKLDGSYVRDFVMESTGREFDPGTARFHWNYLEDLDTYFREISDTNYAEVTCTEGTVQGNVYTIRYQDAFLWSTKLTGEVILEHEESTDRYLFVSNRALWEEKALYREEVATTEYGDVTFAVFEDPESDWNPGSFLFIRNGEQADLVPSPIVRRYPDARFVSCDDVLFDDFDGNGATDLIIIGTFDIDGRQEQHAGYYTGELYNYDAADGNKGYMNLDDDISLSIEENAFPLTARDAALFLKSTM